MRNRWLRRLCLRLLLLSFATLVLAQPAAALNADYWRGGWRTPLGDEPHIYYFVIRGDRVTGAYCRNCSDATTIGFIDGTWDEKAGIDFTVTFANPDGTHQVRRRPACHARRWAADRDGAPRAHGTGTRLTLVKDPRGADPGGGAGVSPPAGHPAGAARGRVPPAAAAVAAVLATARALLAARARSRRCGRRTSSARGSRPRSARWA